MPVNELSNCYVKNHKNFNAYLNYKKELYPNIHLLKYYHHESN